MTSNSTSRPLSAIPPLSGTFAMPRQRGRIIAAFAAETSERGYQAVTVAGVVKRAGIDSEAFFQSFSSREECLLETQQFAMSTALERVVEAAGAVDGWPQRVASGFAAFLDYVVEEPALARTCMVEALVAGSAPAQLHAESLQAFVSLFKVGRSVSLYGGDFPETLEEAIVGGISWIIARALASSPVDEVKALLPELVEFALTPYVGGEAARAVSLSRETS